MFHRCLLDLPNTTRWSLYNEHGQMLVSGRSTTRPTNSALEAEAKDLRWAVLQLKRLGYEEIYILWRLIWVVPDYAKDTKETRRNRLEAVELFNHYQLAIFNSFVKNVTFVKISRKANIVMADKLAKYARTRSQNMVVSWNNDVFWFIYMKFIWREKKNTPCESYIIRFEF